METSARTRVVQQFSELEPTEFRSEIDRRWKSAEQVKQLIVELVENEQMSPIDGLAQISCAVGTPFGYSQFHGTPQVADLYAALPQLLERR